MSSDAQELRCGCCGGALEIVCAKKHCADPLEVRRKSRGPVPPAPVGEEQRKPSGRKFGMRKSPLPEEKQCRTCKTVKPITEFYLSRGSPFPDCKRCWNAYTTARSKARAGKAA